MNDLIELQKRQIEALQKELQSKNEQLIEAKKMLNDVVKVLEVNNFEIVEPLNN